MKALINWWRNNEPRTVEEWFVFSGCLGILIAFFMAFCVFMKFCLKFLLT